MSSVLRTPSFTHPLICTPTPVIRCNEKCLGMTLTYRARLMRKSAMEPGEEGPHPRLLRTLLRKRQKKRGGIKKQQQTARRKAKRRVTRLCLAADAALMRRNHSFISCHLWEITTMAAAGCRWSRRDIRSRKKKQLWEDEDQNRV